MTARTLILSVLLVISVLVMLQTNTADARANYSNNIPYGALSKIQTRATASTHNGDLSELGLIESGSVNESSLSQSTPEMESKLLLSEDPCADKQWALDQIQPSKLWPITKGDPEILIAVLDSGIDRNHEDLEGRVVAEVNFTTSTSSDDIYGHGTHIAGIIAANNNNGIGIVGMAPECLLLNIKTANDSGGCRASVVARGIIWAVNSGASVINISSELKEYSSELEKAVNYAWSRGAIMIAAAGNNGSQLPVYPAYFENCLAVAATTPEDTLAPLSNHGEWVDVVAPGFNIYSTLPGNSYGYKTGTSFATAYVSGLAALFFNIVTDINENGRLNDEVWVAIESNCHQIGVDGVGRGCIKAPNILS